MSTSVVISSMNDHERVLDEIETLITADKKSPSDNKRLDELVDAAEEWENKHWPVAKVSETEAAAFRAFESGE